MKFEIINFNTISLGDFLYKQENVSSPQVRFEQLSRIAHNSHNSINRRYRKFMRFKRTDDISIDKARATRCCNMVNRHVKDLKKVRTYLKKNGMDIQHPIFLEKINKWIDECERIHTRYKHHVNNL
jgi:hypothetical protein